MDLLTALRIEPGAVVSFTGAGGKTTSLFRLARELAAAGFRVVTTTTTHLHASQRRLAPCHLEVDDPAALSTLLPAALARHGHVLLSRGPADEPERLAGLPPDWVDGLSQTPGVDVILVEADGARGLPLKAPAAHEPVVPGSTTLLVPLAGADALGQPLDERHVHRPDRVAELTGLRPGDPVTARALATVLAHPQGGAKGLPAGARLVPLVNQVDAGAAWPRGDAEDAVLASVVTHLLAYPRVAEVVLAAARRSEPVWQVRGRVAGVVLAAGEARRFGGLKQLAPWQGSTVLQHVVAQALACALLDRVLVVLGAQADRVRPVLAGFGEQIEIVVNRDWAAGQATSLQAALDALAGGGAAAAAALFVLADQPQVTPELIDALVTRFNATRAPIVAPRYRGRRGNPVLFDRGTFAELRALQGDTGGRPLITRHAARVAWVDIDRAAPQDIDTRADLARLGPPGSEDV